MCYGGIMKLSDIKKLKKGDKVFWQDPDNNAASRIYTIKTIKVVNPEMIWIVEPDDSFLECLPKELKPLKKYAVKVYWEMSAEHEVFANNKAEAVQKAIDAPLPPSDQWTYTPDSANVDEEMDVQEIK